MVEDKALALINYTSISDGTTADAADLNTPFSTIYNEFNGNIDNANIKSGANISGSKLADDSVPTSKLSESDGWYDLSDTPDTVTYNGNRSYDLVFNSNDLTDTVSNGMRVKLARTVTPPTQCTDLESGSSQYWSKASPSGITFTDDFTCMAWIKLESYTNGEIISRFNATSGWSFRVQSDGTVRIAGYNAGGANVSLARTFQSIPLNKWVHVAAKLDMSGYTYGESNSQIYIDGVAVPGEVARSGTNPTALIQAGDLQIGSYNGATNLIDGKIAQVGLFDTKLSASTIASYASQTLAGNETNCIGCWTFDGDGNDSNANANNLTAQGSATATTTDSPFNATEYGIITANAFSTNTTLTVQVPEGYAIPTSGGVSSVYYSTQDVPYGFPRGRGRWDIESLGNSSSYTATTTPTEEKCQRVTAPVGEWEVSASTQHQIYRTGGTAVSSRLGVSTSSTTFSNPELTAFAYSRASAQPFGIGTNPVLPTPVLVTSQTTYYTLVDTQSTNPVTGASTEINTGVGGGFAKTTFRLAYI